MIRRYLTCLVLVTLLSACVRRAETFYFGNYSEAEKFYNKKQYEKAIQKYQAYLDENPKGNLAVIASYYMGKSHAALGHTEEAMAIFEKIRKEHPDLVWASFAETQLKQLKPPAPAAEQTSKVTPKESPKEVSKEMSKENLDTAKENLVTPSKETSDTSKETPQPVKSSPS